MYELNWKINVVVLCLHVAKCGYLILDGDYDFLKSFSESDGVRGGGNALHLTNFGKDFEISSMTFHIYIFQCSK